MTQKTIKAIYQKPVSYKLIRDGYKTVTNSFTPDDNTPSTMTLATPSEVYTSNLQYTVDTSLDGEPVLIFDSFISPDNETVESAQYCYALKGKDYNYNVWIQEKKVYDNFTAVGSIILDENTGLVTNFSSSNYIQIPNSFNSDDITEAQVCFITGSDVTTTQPFFLSSKSDDTTSFVISNSTLYMVRKLGGYLGDYQSLGLNVLPNSKYWFKFTQSNNLITSYLSTNGINFTQGNSISRNRTFTTLIGSGVDNDESTAYFTGSLDLSDMYIKTNNQTWWTPYTSHSGWKDVQIPGMLDESVTTDDWNQSQNYKLYQLKQQDGSNDLQLTLNGITNEGQKYNQYIDQITIPARDYKWYYHSIGTGVYDNYDIIGSPTINKNTGVVSGFTSSNYLKLPNQFPIAGSYKMIFNTIYKTSTTGYEQSFFARDDNVNKTLYFQYANNKIAYWNDVNYEGVTSFINNVRYWICMEFDFSTLNLKVYSLVDNDLYDISNLPNINTWTSEINVTLTINDFANKYFRIGTNASTNHWYCGTVDLSKCIIYKDNDIWWSPMSTKDKWIANKSIYDYSVTGLYADTLDFTKSYIGVNNSEYHKYSEPKVCLMPIDGGELIDGKNKYLISTALVKMINGNSFGNITFDDETGIASGFSSTTGITLPETFPSTVSNFDMIFKGSISDFDDDNVLLGYANTDEGYIGVIDRDTHSFSYWFGSWTQGQTTINFNTYYWFRVIHNGSSTKGYILLDNGYNLNNLPALSQWSEEWTLANDKFNGRLLNLGYNFATTSEHWTGNIDLDNSIIRINGSNWWTGTNMSTLYQLNCTKVGNPIFEQTTGVVTGFSSSNSLDISSSYGTIVGTYYAKFTTGSDITSFQNVLAPYPSFELYVENGALMSWLESEGHSITCGSVSQNTTYWAKIVLTNNTLTLSYSTDGITYTGDVTDSISYSSCNSFHIGTGVRDITSRYWRGSIDLSETYIESNNEIIWRGANNLLTNYTPNVIKVGNVNFDSYTSELTNFSDSNYAYCNNSSVIFTSPWEITVKFNSPFSINSNIVGCNVDTYGLRFGIDSNTKKLGLLLGRGSASSGWFINATTTATFQPNTDYWVKVGWTGTIYYLKYSTNGITYTTDISINNSTAIAFDTYPFRIGNNGVGITRPFDGTVYLKDCTFEVNNQIVWTGATSNFRPISGCLYNYRDDGQQHDFDVYYDSNYTQPILVGHGEVYSQGTKVDTITIPEHKLWTYSNGGVWTERRYEPESSGEFEVVEESYTPTPSPAVVIPEITFGYDVIVNLTGTPSAFQSFTIDGDTYTSSDFINDRLVITLAADQTYTWTATSYVTGTVSPDNGSFLLDDDVTINIQCQQQQYFITPGNEPTE